MALLALLFAYLLLIALLGAWLLLPDLRPRFARPGQDPTLCAGPSARPHGRRLAIPRWRHAIAALTVLVAVPALVLWQRQQHAFEDFDHTLSRDTNPQIAALLAGEQLAPPQPLPPELFLTREVERERPATATASRNWALLDAVFRQRLLLAYRLMREQHGVEMVLLEGYRSPQRQTELAALGPQVTLAGAGASYHQHGLAADSAFLIDGRIVISEQDPRAAGAYARFGALAQSLGLTWGGSWRSLRDLGHVELRRPGVLIPASNAASPDGDPSP